MKGNLRVEFLPLAESSKDSQVLRTENLSSPKNFHLFVRSLVFPLSFCWGVVTVQNIINSWVREEWENRFPSQEKPLRVGGWASKQNSAKFQVKRCTIKLSYNICITFTHALTSREATDIKTNGEHPNSPNAGRTLQLSQLCSWDCKTRDWQRNLFFIAFTICFGQVGHEVLKQSYPTALWELCTPGLLENNSCTIILIILWMLRTVIGSRVNALMLQQRAVA